MKNHLSTFLLSVVVLAAAGCATQPSSTAPAAAQAPRSIIELVCQPAAQAGGSPTVAVRNGITSRITARVLWPTGVISTVAVAPGQTHPLMDLKPEDLPCKHPLKLLDWSPA